MCPSHSMYSILVVLVAKPLDNIKVVVLIHSFLAKIFPLSLYTLSISLSPVLTYDEHTFGCCAYAHVVDMIVNGCRGSSRSPKRVVGVV